MRFRALRRFIDLRLWLANYCAWSAYYDWRQRHDNFFWRLCYTLRWVAYDMRHGFYWRAFKRWLR